MEIGREGKTFDVNVVPRYDSTIGIQRIGIAPATSMEVDKIFAFDGTDSPAQKGGLQTGDKITAVNGKSISTESEFREIEGASPGKELVLTVLRDSEEIDLKVTASVVARWMIGLSCATTKIDGVKKDSFAHSLGLEKGDEIIKVNSQDVKGLTELLNTIKDSPDGIVTLQVARGNGTKYIKLTKSGEETVKEFFAGISTRLGIIVDSTVEGFPAEKIGIRPGDRIVSIGGENISEWEQLLQIVSSNQDKEMEITWARNFENITRKIKPEKNEEGAQGMIGIKFKEKKIVRKYGLIGACAVGTHKTIINIKRIYLTIQGFVSKKLSTKALGGPVLIAQASYASAQSGIGKLMYFLAIISINLAVLNILPIPVLDGGHLLFIGVEKIKGSPVSVRTLSIANYIGFALIITLMIYATRNDIMRLLT
jgi:regulator of sigma E protease